MARQFNLANIWPSADGKTVTADIMSAGFDALEASRYGVEVVNADTGAHTERVRFPSHKLIMSNVLDLDR